MEKTFEGESSAKPIFIAIIIVVFFLAFLLLNGFQQAKLVENPEKTTICGDGTPYDSCSATKPYFCEQGILVEKISVCGGSSISEIRNDSCFSQYKTYPKSIILSYILNGEENLMGFTVYGELTDHLSRVSRIIDYSEDEAPSRTDFKLKIINYDEQRELLMPLVVKIQNIANDPIEQARIAISIVQNIPYGSTEKKLLFAGSEINYSRYPYEVLYYGQGICGEKATLMAFLLKELGYGVSIFYFADENHEAIGIKCPIKKSFRDTGYCFVETGGPAVITDSSMEYVDGIKLESEPEILVISEGISLPENMFEYKDAKTLRDIRNRNFFGLLKFWRLDGINEEYGLAEEYNLE